MPCGARRAQTHFPGRCLPSTHIGGLLVELAGLDRRAIGARSRPKRNRPRMFCPVFLLSAASTCTVIELSTAPPRRASGGRGATSRRGAARSTSPSARSGSDGGCRALSGRSAHPMVGAQSEEGTAAVSCTETDRKHSKRRICSAAQRRGRS